MTTRAFSACQRKYKMKIRYAESRDGSEISPLIAKFRAHLSSLRGIKSKITPRQCELEFQEFSAPHFRVFAAETEGKIGGYIVCKIDEPCVWVEQLFVEEKFRRKGLASALFGQAEKLAASFGEETVYNYIHPNNQAIISFLAKKGYNVLNLIEIRKKFKNESASAKIDLGGNEFNY
mgnify:CR=1 FL=1